MSVAGAALELLTIVKPLVGKAEEVASWEVDHENPVTDLSRWRRVTFDDNANVVALDLEGVELEMELETLAETSIIRFARSFVCFACAPSADELVQPRLSLI